MKETLIEFNSRMNARADDAKLEVSELTNGLRGLLELMANEPVIVSAFSVPFLWSIDIAIWSLIRAEEDIYGLSARLSGGRKVDMVKAHERAEVKNLCGNPLGKSLGERYLELLYRLPIFKEDFHQVRSS